MDLLYTHLRLITNDEAPSRLTGDSLDKEFLFISSCT